MEEIIKYFPDLSKTQIEQFTALGEGYKEWNSKINVISRKDINMVYIHHILHSLSIAKVMPFKPGTQVLDIGTGGGLPGLPLAIMFPDSDFLLVDSIAKKIKVVQGLTEKLDLKNVESKQIRAEEIKEKFDFVVCRAVKKLAVLYGWTGKLIHKNNMNTLNNGYLLLKGGDLTEEIAELGKKVKLHPLNDFFDVEHFRDKYVLYLKKV